MKKSYSFVKIALIGCFIVLVGNSCSNLDETLYTSIASDSFYKNDAEFSSAVGAIYTNLYGMMGAHGGLWAAQENSTDESMIPQRGGDWYDGGQWIRLHQHQSLPSDDVINGAWSQCFSGVSTANRLIYQLNAASPDRAKPYIAELKTMRALYYYWLLDDFGNVPIISTFPVTETSPATQSRANVYAFVESELAANVPLLSKAVDQTTYGRMNYYNGRMLQAKLYLNAGVYTGTSQWQKALDAANEIINSKAYVLSATFKENFLADNAGSKENMFAIPYDEKKAQGFNLNAMTLTYASQGTYKLTFQPWDGYCTTQEFYNSFDDADTRKKANFVAGLQHNADGTVTTDAGADDPDGPPVNFTPEINQLLPNCYHQAGARIGKFEFQLGGSNNMNNDFPIFRYADVLMVAAEASMNLGNMANALGFINQVRTRAGVPNLTTLDNTSLAAERGKEMFAEAWRRQDMIRLGTYSRAYDWHYDYNIRNKPGTEKPCVTLLPVPTSQLNANKGLVQNDCYK